MTTDRTKVKLFYCFRRDADEVEAGTVHAMIVAALSEKDALEAAAREAATEHNQPDGWNPDNVEVHELTPGKLAADYTSILWTWGSSDEDDTGTEAA